VREGVGEGRNGSRGMDGRGGWRRKERDGKGGREGGREPGTLAHMMSRHINVAVIAN